MRCLLIGPKHNGIGRYMRLLWSGLNLNGVSTDWLGFPELCFDKREVLQRAQEFANGIDLASYDLVHIHFGMYDMEQVLLLYLRDSVKPRWIFSAHSISGRLFAKLADQELHAEVDRQLHAIFDHYIFFSSYGASGFGATIGNGATRLFYPSTHEPTALKPEDEEAIRERYNLPDEFLALPGYPSPWKDHETLIQALSMIGDPVDFIFAGPWWSEKIVKDAIHRGPVQIRVLDRELDELEFLHVIRRSLFGVLAYQEHATRQGVGVIANYLWEGKACIVSDAMCLPEYVGEAGIVVPQRDAKALSSAISLLLHDVGRRRQLESLARQRADSLMSWRVHLEQHKRLYQHVLTH